MRAHSPELEYEFKGTNSAPRGALIMPLTFVVFTVPRFAPRSGRKFDLHGADLWRLAALVPSAAPSQRWRAASS